MKLTRTGMSTNRIISHPKNSRLLNAPGYSKKEQWNQGQKKQKQERNQEHKKTESIAQK
jgi:hypothetical protein